MKIIGLALGGILPVLCALGVSVGGARAAVADEGPLKVLFIGNSLTRHGKAPKIGWSNDWGMAASALEKDFAHQVAKGLSDRLKRPADLRLNNLAAFERNLATFDLEKALAADFAWRPDFIVVQLGENARHPATDEEQALFRDKMTEIFKLCARRAGTDMVATSVFCVDSVKPRLQREAAKAAGVKFAPLYDLGRHKEYKAIGLFAHAGVAGHPGDRGHAMIAERILDAFFPKPLPSWRGDGLKAWRANEQVADFRVEDGAIKGRVCGRDAQLMVTLPEPFAPKANQFFLFRMKTTCGGRGQLFWTRRGDDGPSESRQQRFTAIGDGAWHDCRIAAGWCGPEKIRAFRFDFPADYGADSVFEISEFRIVEEGESLEVDTRDAIGVSFSLQAPPGLHYGQLSWASDETGVGEFGFTTATDGRRHAYWFDLRRAKNLNWGPRRGQPSWKGLVSRFGASRKFGEIPLKLEGLEFVSKAPDLPADPVITSAFPSEAIPRAGRPLVVEAVVRNYGTRPAANLRFAFDGLPKGCALLDAGELTPRDPLPGSDGRETVNDSAGPQLGHQRVFSFRLTDPGAGVHRFGLTLAADGVPARRVEVVADVKPSLGLAPQAYPAEPKPVDTAPYEIGALLFPGWTLHQWHAVWGHDPVRKPLLGWYDETKPETIDWQIKHLVENGVSFVSVDWYWRDGKQHLNHWMKAFKEAKFRKYLKWHLMWDNGYNSAEDQEKVAKFWCESYFGDTQYQKIGGRPVVAICNPSGMEQRMAGKGGAKRLVEITQRVAREHGFPGVYFVAMRGMGADSEDPAFLRKFADYGFDVTTVYGFRGGIPGTPQGASMRRDFTWMADVSPSHWRALAKNGTLPFWPSLSTGYDDRPWRGDRVLEIYNYDVGNFRRICEEGKRFSDETGIRTFLMGPLDEWGEGSIGYPNREHGFGILEAVRDTFGRKPAEGWPVNYAPEDVGLACPQKP